MNAPTDYDVITESSTEALARKVLEAIREGWIPQGGVATDRLGRFLQAIVKY